LSPYSIILVPSTVPRRPRFALTTLQTLFTLVSYSLRSRACASSWSCLLFVSFLLFVYEVTTDRSPSGPTWRTTRGEAVASPSPRCRRALCPRGGRRSNIGLRVRKLSCFSFFSHRNNVLCLLSLDLGRALSSRLLHVGPRRRLLPRSRSGRATAVACSWEVKAGICFPLSKKRTRGAK
jgi:hypothetical protein